MIQSAGKSYAANLRAAYLEPGTQTVTMRFPPSGWTAGVMVTGLALVALAGLVIAPARSHRADRALELNNKPPANDYLEEKGL